MSVNLTPRNDTSLSPRRPGEGTGLREVRLRSALGYVAPLAKLEGREAQIFAERGRKLEQARRQRQLRRQEVFAPLADRVGNSPTAALN